MPQTLSEFDLQPLRRMRHAPVPATERGEGLGLPVVELGTGLLPSGLLPQGRDGSLLVRLDPDASGADGDHALHYEASSREWYRMRIGEQHRMPWETELPAMSKHAWTFGVSEDGKAHPLASLSGRRSLGRFEVERCSGWVTLTDDLGRRSRLHRLFPKRPRRRSPSERSAVLEILRARRPAAGASGPDLQERLTAEWVPVASLESNGQWLFVSIESQGISFAIRF